MRDKMIKYILPMVLAACVAPAFGAEGWIYDDMEAAMKQASEQKKGILVEFAGRKWISVCQSMRANVLDKPEFIKEVGQDFIMLSLDFPEPDSAPEPGKEGNVKYLNRYGIFGFPTLMFMDSKGKVLAGFVGGCPEQAVIAMKDDAKRRLGFISAAEDKLAAAKTDDEKIAALATILKYAPEKYIDLSYKEFRTQLLELDKNDKSGYRAEQARKEVVKKELDEVQMYFREKGSGITDIKEGLNIARNYPNRDKLQPETQQKIMLTECSMMENAGMDLDMIMKVLDKVIELGPETDFGRMAIDGKKWLQYKKEHPEVQ